MLLTRNDFGKFENLVNILGISRVFLKLLEIELCFYHWAMTKDKNMKSSQFTRVKTCSGD